MFQTWGTWLGIESENGQRKEESECNVGENSQVKNVEGKCAASTQPGQKDTGFSGYIYHLASSASKKLSESVVGTAQSLKKSVEEGRINGIIDKTILGDFQKEQERFMQENKAKDSSAAVPPWVGFNDEDTIQQQILSLSADKRNFLRDPPAGVQFDFDFEKMYPVAMVMLEEDKLLRKMRFHLVPKQVKEEIFWKNYFYRLSLIKQSAQLTALTVQQAVERRNAEKTDSSPEDPQQKEETPDWEKELQEELQEYDVLADNESRDDNWDREIEQMLMEDI